MSDDSLPEEQTKDPIQESSKYMYHLKSQYDFLMREAEQVFERKQKFKEIKSDIFSWVNIDGSPREGPRIDNTVDKVVDVNNVNLAQFTIKIWPYQMEEI